MSWLGFKKKPDFCFFGSIICTPQNLLIILKSRRKMVVFYNIFFVGRYINCRFFVLFGDPPCSTWQNGSPFTSRLLFSFFFIQITLFCMYFLIIIVVCSSSIFFRLILKNGGMYVVVALRSKMILQNVKWSWAQSIQDLEEHDFLLCFDFTKIHF